MLRRLSGLAVLLIIVLGNLGVWWLMNRPHSDVAWHGEIRSISFSPYRKDDDALTPVNAGLLLSGRAHLVSCTPAGVMLLLKEYVGDIAGMDALVIGRSLLFGKPAAQLLLAANATVTMAHSRTRDLPAVAAAVATWADGGTRAGTVGA